MKYKMMTHLIAGYPDFDSSLEVARALADGGAAYLEIQFPFSDGTADGPLIQSACSTAIDKGFKIADGFKLVKQIREYSDVPVFVMTYANIAFCNGITSFLNRCKEAGASGIIIPDLPPDSDESLFSEGAALGLHVVPVIAPSISEERLAMVFATKQEYLYASLRKGVTGASTEIGDDNLSFIRKVSAAGMKVLGGFGISTREQVEQLAPHIHAAVVGSEFLRVIQSIVTSGGDLYQAVRSKIESLVR